jgi:pimeloyl-ACP methyl ester carboxylesterase
MEFSTEAVHRHGWRLVTVSRPGSARSTRLPGRTVADVVPDAVAVLDALGVGRFVVAGASGGGPHALACAALLPDRVDAAQAICSAAPYDADGLDFLAGMGDDNVIEFGLALEGEAALRPWLDEHMPALRTASAEQIVEELASILPEVDRACLRGDLGEQFARAMHSAASGTSDGWLDDDLAFTRAWGFDLAAIEVPVSLWQGTEDLMVPFSHGQWLAAHIPGVRSHLEEGEGHLSLTVGAIDRMLDELDDLAG